MSEAAAENLRQYQGQLDEEGICVAVSRQAVDEVLEERDELLKDLEEAHMLLLNADYVPCVPMPTESRLEENRRDWRAMRDAFLHKTAPGIARRGEGDE